MKRTLFLLIVAIGIVAISTGCSSGDTQILEDKISQLEQQLNSQNAANSNGTAASSNISSQNDAANTETSSAPAQNGASNTATSSAPVQNNNSQQPNTNFDTTQLSQKVESVVQLADSTQRKSTYGENINLYGQVKMQIEQVEFELDQFEDQIEMALRTGTLTYDQYYQLDRTLDQLDHRLDMAKDSLEWRLGVDD